MKDFLKMIVTGLTMLVVVAAAVGVRVVAFAPDVLAHFEHAAPAAQPATAAAPSNGHAS